MIVQLALYKGDGALANAFIRWWAGSQYSHCELVVDGWCYSSSVMDKGVRRKRIDLDSGSWDVVPLPWADADQVIEFFEQTDYRAYNWLGLLSSQVLNLGKAWPDAAFCSEWCAEALGVPDPSMYSPAALGELARFMGGVLLSAGQRRRG